MDCLSWHERVRHMSRYVVNFPWSVWYLHLLVAERVVV